MPAPAVAARLRQGTLKKSPIREIMKLADRQNIVAMGLDPADVISFAGGWVNHEAPEGLRDEYRNVADDPKLFHELGAYSPTRGLPALRTALIDADRALYGTPGLADEHLIVGQSSTQLTHTLFVALLDPGDRVLLFDPSYANYGPQLELGPEGVQVVTLPVLDAEAWTYMADGEDLLLRLARTLDQAKPRLILFSSPDNPTSRIVPDPIFFAILEIAAEHDCFVAVDYAYRAQCFGPPPAHFSASPVQHPNLIRIHSNSKWCRGLGRRLGWIEAAPEVIDALEVVQQGTTLCGDTLHQYVLAEYLVKAIADRSLDDYLDRARRNYARAAQHAVRCIDEHLGMRRLEPEGGLYVVVDVGRDADAFVRDALQATGVIFVPGRGFGDTLAQAIRVSYGPLVHDLDRIEEGFRRVRDWLATGRARAPHPR
jgi:aspartate/methionine/tyrosine aminotransferase